MKFCIKVVFAGRYLILGSAELKASSEGVPAQICVSAPFLLSQKAERPALESRGPPGGLFGIDQEVVTLRGPFGKLRVPTQLRRGINPKSPVVVRWFLERPL